jgi:hypothetical protein
LCTSLGCRCLLCVFIFFAIDYLAVVLFRVKRDLLLKKRYFYNLVFRLFIEIK